MEKCAHSTRKLTPCRKKSEKNDIRHIKDDNNMYQQCLYIYDIVYLNGQVLTNLPLKERILKLREVVPYEIPGRIHFADRVMASTRLEVVNSLNNAIDACDEGIMIKDPDSVYKPGARTKSGWIKIKPEYQKDLTDTCDLVILGGYYSSGKRHPRGTISHFLCGIQDGDIFRSFCRVGSGVSQKDLYDLVAKLSFQRNPFPNVQYGKEKPDVKMDPKNSKVLEIKAAEVIRSDQYHARYTLRFPRVKTIRHDKIWSDCMTSTDLAALTAPNKGKLTKRFLDTDESPQCKKKRKTALKTPTVDSLYQPSSELGKIKPISQKLRGKIIVTEPWPKNPELKSKLEEIIVKLGGIVEQNARNGFTWAYIQTGGSIRAQNLVNEGYCNVIKHTWLLDCENSKFRALRPSDMIFTAEETQESFDQVYDQFGDSYGSRATLESLEYSMKQVEVQELELKNLNAFDIADIEDQYGISGTSIGGLFRPFKAYFHKSVPETYRYTFQFYGGQVEEQFDEFLNNFSYYFVTEGVGENDLKIIKTARRNDVREKKAFRILNYDWISNCLQEKRLVDENDYIF